MSRYREVKGGLSLSCARAKLLDYQEFLQGLARKEGSGGHDLLVQKNQETPLNPQFQ